MSEKPLQKYIRKINKNNDNRYTSYFPKLKVVWNTLKFKIWVDIILLQILLLSLSVSTSSNAATGC